MFVKQLIAELDNHLDSISGMCDSQDPRHFYEFREKVQAPYLEIIKSGLSSKS